MPFYTNSVLLRIIKIVFYPIAKSGEQTLYKHIKQTKKKQKNLFFRFTFTGHNKIRNQQMIPDKGRAAP
jgi:hypothetical protein